MHRLRQPKSLIHAAGLLAGVLAAAPAFAAQITVDFEEFSGPDIFTGATPPLDVARGTVSGGQVLSAVRNLYANRTTVYGTGGACPGCVNRITLAFDEPVSDLRFVVMNGMNIRMPFLIMDNSGRRQTVWVNAFQTRDPATGAYTGKAEIRWPGANVRFVTIAMRTPIRNWFNFYVDDIRFEVPDPDFTISLSAFVPHDNVPGGPTSFCRSEPDPDDLPPGLVRRGAPDKSNARWLRDPDFPVGWRRHRRGGPRAKAGTALGDDAFDESSHGSGGRRQLYFAGDSRGFVADAASYRLRQVVTVVPDGSVDADGLKAGSAQSLAGEARAYAADAMTNDGAIGPLDDDAVPNDCSLFHAAYLPETDKMDISVARTGPQTVDIRLSGALDAPFAGPAVVLGAMDWDITVTIDTSGATPRWSVAGAHDGFPAWELYVNGVEIYRSDPGAPPYSFDGHVRRLLPPLDAEIAPASGDLP